MKVAELRAAEGEFDRAQKGSLFELNLSLKVVLLTGSLLPFVLQSLSPTHDPYRWE